LLAVDLFPQLDSVERPKAFCSRRVHDARYAVRFATMVSPSSRESTSTHDVPGCQSCFEGVSGYPARPGRASEWRDWLPVRWPVSERERLRAVIRGAVQGVGFRPFVYRLARGYSLEGWVLNSAQGVHVEVEGSTPALQAFLVALDRERPRGR